VGAAAPAPVTPVAVGTRAAFPLDRFEGALALAEVNGAERRIVVTIRNWTIQNGHRVDDFPVPGLMVVQVRGGSLTTIVGGQRRRRGTDEFFVVPSGTKLSLETDDDTASFQVVTLRSPQTQPVGTPTTPTPPKPPTPR